MAAPNSRNDATAPRHVWLLPDLKTTDDSLTSDASLLPPPNHLQTKPTLTFLRPYHPTPTMSDNNEDADYWEIYDRGYADAERYYTSADQSKEYSDSDSSEDSEDSDSSPPRPPSPPPRPPSPRRQTDDKYKYKYKYKHNKDKHNNDKDRHDDKDKHDDEDKPNDVKVNAVNSVTCDPYCAPHTYYTDDSEPEDDYIITNTRVHL